MGNLYHCTLTFSCRLSPPSSRSLQSVLDFFYSLEGLGTFGTSHLPGGVENSNLPGGGSHYPSSIWGVQLPEVGTSHISWGSNSMLMEALIHLAGSSYLWLGLLTHLGDPITCGWKLSSTWEGPATCGWDLSPNWGGVLQPAREISHSKSYVLHVQNFSIFFSS